MPSTMASNITTERVTLYGLASCFAALAVIFRAFRERSNFYAATVWLGRSNGCMLVLLNFGLFTTLVFGKAVQKVFFGELRAVEIEVSISFPNLRETQMLTLPPTTASVRKVLVLARRHSPCYGHISRRL